VRKAILIGLGGMGQRYVKALSQLNFKLVGICDQKKDKLKKFDNIICKKTTQYRDLLNLNADIVCISSNTSSRENIIKDFFTKSKIKRILTEKPLAISYEKSLKILKLINRNKKKRILVNTFRSLSPNFKRIKKLFLKKKEIITHISILSPSAGLGNMGSIFFDLCNYFLEEKIISVSCQIDTTGTINPRGKIFKDPGGYGFVKYRNNKKIFFDLSENTSMPYQIILKSKNLEVSIDEINNEFIVKERPNKFKKKPPYYYLYRPDKKKLVKTQKYDVIQLTKYSINELFKKKFKNNIINSIKAMEIVFGCHASQKIEKSIIFPLNKKYHKMNINFP